MQPPKEYTKLAKAASGWVPVPMPPELVDYRYVMRENCKDDDYYGVKD